MRLDSVSFTWPDGPCIAEDFSLRIEPGSITALVGASGCGKSTVLRLLAGLIAPDSGTVTAPRSSRAFVFQSPNLLPWLSALDNVALPLKLEGISAASRREQAREALERVGLSDAAASLPRALSGGMRMRVSLARALVTRPELLLMDEPFSSLDALTRRQMHAEFLALWESLSATVVMVTHDLEEAALLCDRVVVLSGQPVTIAADNLITAPRPRDRHAPDLVAQVAVLEGAL
ncbi:MAG: NitT/TauT family transport system ATP-binding protein [Myxococcota bacterium]|jgi:NitT/TauT family transport system ATP-binding protein